MSDYTDIKETLESPGMKLIMLELDRKHKSAGKKYRECSDMEQVFYLQALQTVIDTAIPEIMTSLMNKHIEPHIGKKSPEWWHFAEWFKQLFR